MEDSSALAAKIGEAIQVLQAPQTTPEVRRAANEFVLQLREHPSAVAASVQLAASAAAAPPAVRFFAFRLVAAAAAEGRLRPEEPRTAEVRSLLVDMLLQSTLSASGNLQDVPGFVCEKYTQALAAVAVYCSEWPAGWPQLQQQLFEVGQRSRTHATLVLSFFKNVSEVLQSDAASRLSVQRRKALSAHLRDSCQELFKFLALVVASLFPGSPELDRAAVLLVTELSASVPVRAFLTADLDAFLRGKLSDVAVRAEVVQAFTEWLAKDVAKDLKEAPERMMQLITTICQLTGHCQASGSLGADDYEVHRSMAVLVRDFVECNKPSLEKRPELQALVYTAAVNFLRYPSICVQFEAASVVPQVLKAALPEPRKGTAKVEAAAPPAWLRIKEELMPLLFLSAFKRVPPTFDFFALPTGYVQAMEITSELDAEEDLPGVQSSIKGRLRETMAAMAHSPAAVLASLQFLHETLPRVFAAPQQDAAAFLGFDASLVMLECVVPNVKAASGPQAVEACGTLLGAVLRAPLPGAEHEGRRLEFLGRAGPALDVLAELGAAQGRAEVAEIAPLFNHLFSVIESGSPELRRKALASCISICKAAPRAIRPVLQALVEKAAALLKSISDEQHMLCEALVAASTAAQNFEQQQTLLQNLLAPLVSQWGPLTQSLAAPGKLTNGLLGDRSELDAAHRLLLCFAACFRASTVPSRPDVIAAGGFATPGTDNCGVIVRNPAAGVASAVLPGLASLFRAFHTSFPSDAGRMPAGLDQATAAKVVAYSCALEKEEVRALTSSLDTKRNDEADAWADPFPPPPGEDPARVLQGRQLLYGLRSNLYKCLGAAFSVQDGVLTHPELSAMLSTAFMEGLDCAHPYHVELQLRSIWLVAFAPSGLQQSSEALRRSFAAAALPRLMAKAAGRLEECWRRLRAPEGEPSGNPVLLWAACTGTVMASRTFVELASSLVMHGGVPGKYEQMASGTTGGGGGTTAGAQTMQAEAPERQGQRRKGKDRSSGGGGKQMSDGGGGPTEPMSGGGDGGGASKPGQGFAGIVFTTGEVLEAVQGALLASLRWQDPKSLGHALVGTQAAAVRLMSGGEAYQSLRDVHVSHPEAPQRCMLALQAVLRPLVALCASPPEAPGGDGALHTVIGKPFFDFFSPEKQQGQLAPSPFAAGVTGAIWPILWGMCQIFVQVCKKSQIKADAQQVVNFPALMEACQLLASLRRSDQQGVQSLLATMLDEGADAKMKRGALRSLIRAAVDPDAAPGELLA